MVVVCCICKKIKQADGSFAEGNVPEGAEVSHGICEPCFHIQYPCFEFEYEG